VVEDQPPVLARLQGADHGYIRLDRDSLVDLQHSGAQFSRVELGTQPDDRHLLLRLAEIGADVALGRLRYAEQMI
ncbi:hypothetical protein LTR94_035561, partial [Friedmanniomyces endolithicus]